MLKISKNLEKLADIFYNNNQNLYAVGGFVRDSLLSIETRDIDLCSKADLTEVQDFLKNTDFKFTLKSKTFFTATIQIENEIFEYTTFRKDFYKDGSHCPFKVKKVKSIKTDAKRRDFTINSIYLDLKKMKFVDPFFGLNDLKSKVLKTTLSPEKTLKFDGERILRLAKFYAKYDFEIEEKTLFYAKKFSKNIEKLSKKKIEEFSKSFYNLNIEQKKRLKNFFRKISWEKFNF